VRFDTTNDKQELVLSPLDKLDEPASLIELRDKVANMLGEFKQTTPKSHRILSGDKV
jgi:hypothetical protein